MDVKFFMIFVAVTAVIEVVLCIIFLRPKTKEFKKTDYSHIDAHVTAYLLDSGYYYDSNDNVHYYSKYEWVYNGKKHHTTFNTGNMGDRITITVNKRTGKYKRPEAERKKNKAMFLVYIIAAAVGYIIASILCGYSPLFK